MMPARPVRLLSVLYPFRPEFSGEGEWWLRLIPFLRSRGVEVEILARGPSSSRREADAAPDSVEGVAVHRVPALGGAPGLGGYARGLASAVAALRRRRKTFDVALFHGPVNDAVFASCLAGRFGGWRTAYKATLLGGDDLATVATGGRMGRLRLAALTLAHGLVSLSRVLVQPYDDRPWVRRSLLVVPQGVDLERFSPADPERKRAARRRLGLPEDARVALFCGAVIHRKGVDLLVDAWQRVSRAVPGSVLLMVGPNHESGLDDPEMRRFSEAIAGRIRDLGLAQSVRLLGYQREMPPFYAAADAFVFPSRFEGWGAAITEAMASGLPSVASRLHGIAEEQFEDGVEGFIVRSEDPSAYADRLLTLLTDESVARRMGTRARRRAESRFAVEGIADAYAGFFRRVAGTGAFARPSRERPQGGLGRGVEDEGKTRAARVV